MIRAIRISLGISQRKLGDLVGLNRQFLSRTENLRGAPTIATMRRIASGLGVPLGVIVELATMQLPEPSAEGR